MTSINPVQCQACERLDRSGAGQSVVVPNRCAAFPGGIPIAIAIDGEDHRSARGDEAGGMTFKQADTDNARDAFGWWQRTFGSSTMDTQ